MPRSISQPDRFLQLSPNLQGALFMSVSMAGFTINDAIVKSVVGSMNMGQVMLVRGLFATVLLAAFAWHQQALRPLRTIAHPTVALRVLGEMGATIAFLTALSHLPIANVSAILQALPLAVTMGAALFFAEPVGWRRWLAICVGFGGVMIVVRPGFEGFNAFSLSALICVLFCALRDLATRQVPDDIPSLLVSLVTAGAVTLCGGLLVAPLGGWSAMSIGSTALIAGAAALLIIGYQFIIMSMRLGEISFVAPFRYTALLWAILLGYLFFGDVPDAAMVVGATIIIGSGLYTLYRERVVAKRRIAAQSTSPIMAPDGI
jgi:drug/metabolite transporter (DMT)-like permease